MGIPLRRARAAPSARFGFLIRARSEHELIGPALRAGTAKIAAGGSSGSLPNKKRRARSADAAHGVCAASDRTAHYTIGEYGRVTTNGNLRSVLSCRSRT